MTGWCILETAPNRTLALATALTDAGIVNWTPTETVKGEPPKAKEFEAPRRPRKVPDFVTRPLLPSIVFARAEHLGQLMAMARSPAQTYQAWDAAIRRMVTKGHPHFHIFCPGSRPIADSELDALRRIEGRRKPRGKVKAFTIGDAIKMTEGAYGGLRGTVVAVVSKSQIKIRVEGWKYEPIVQAWILLADVDNSREVHHSAPKSEQASSAKAA